MTGQEDVWRPLGVDDDDQIAEYDALHEGVPEWMYDAFWAWIKRAITVRRYSTGTHSNSKVAVVDEQLVEHMSQRLRVRMPELRTTFTSLESGRKQFGVALGLLQRDANALQVADYLLGHGGHAEHEDLEKLLSRANSAWKVGRRSGTVGLVRRVPVGVQVAMDDVMGRAGNAGVRLAKAWEALYGLEPNASIAYGLAIKAVEDVTAPLVIPADRVPTLGKVISVMRDQGNWRLPMLKEHQHAPSNEVVIGMLRVLWDGQHDRHGGDPSAPGNVSIDEATVAVSLAVTLVNLFSAGLVARSTS